MTAQLPVRKAGEIVAWATIDADNFEQFSQWRWSLSSKGYAMCSGSTSMHRLVLGRRKGDPGDVDHVNRDKMDNRRVNLRVVTHSENLQNSERCERGTQTRNRARELRLAGMSQREISESLGISQTYVSSLLSLKPRPGRTLHPWRAAA